MFNRIGLKRRLKLYKVLILNFYLVERERLVQDILERVREAKRSNNWDYINSRSLRSRLSWYEENKSRLNFQGTDVRKAYMLLLTRFVESGARPEELPIVYEDERRIVWRSYNWCPVLEACKRDEFDTREVCRKGYEKSVQALIEKINPKLQFSRNYERIRPYAEYCEEIIELIE
ncbi:MAG: hypothetical protein QXI93_01815 [Candidatus Methanomethylicia archaeon]